MQQEVERFLNLRHLPASVTVEQAAGYLGISPHEITILLARGLLKPLGHPAPNGQKFFLTATLEELRRDEKWFGKARDAIAAHWQHKNARRASAQDNARHHEPAATVGARKEREQDEFPARA